MIVRQFSSLYTEPRLQAELRRQRGLWRGPGCSDLTEDYACRRRSALLMRYDDASPLVRPAMAEVFAQHQRKRLPLACRRCRSTSLRRASGLEHSPLLIYADLFDIIATGNG